jgi:acetolactate synthase-1/3 small subunit
MAEPRHHTLSVLVENRAGVLTRIAGLFARRGFNIYSLAVAPTDDEHFSRITIVVDVESAPLEQITKQLHKLINVITIEKLAPGDAVERELMLVTVEASDEVRALADRYDVRVLDTGTDQLTLSMDDHPDRIDEFEQQLEPLGIVTVQRTGRVALPKLAQPA